jgi:unsaturated rhamnogalacturonyl hydrolase
MLMEYFDSYVTKHQPYKGGSWCYEDGLVYRGCEKLYYASGEKHWLDHVQRLIAPQILEGPDLLGYNANDYNIDNIMSGRALLFLHRETGDQTYMDVAKMLIRQLETQPRTRSNIYWHKNRYPWQVWLDGLYMGAPFQIEYGLLTGNDALVEDALTQVSTAMDKTFVPATKLYAHAYDEARKQIWSNDETGHTQAHWSRAVGWLAMALVDIAELVGPERFAPLKDRTSALLDEILRWRQADGMWLQVMNEPDLKGNWTESSASAMFCYELIRGEALGLWTGSSGGLLRDLIDRAVVDTKDGGKEMAQMCHVAGLGMYQGRFRDGTATYYISEDIVSDDPKGVGPLMMAVSARMMHEDPTDMAIAGQ